MDKFLNSNSLTLCYQDLGHTSNPVILLIAGLGEQLGEWPDAFCQQLCARDYRVIRFDNRDIGRSSKVTSTYSLSDMADDALGILDALDVPAAHIVGMSMGGMIAQILCAQNPQRVLSFCSIMSSSGNPDLPAPTPAVQAMLVKKTEGTLDSFIDNWVDAKLLIDSPSYPADESKLRARATANCQRSYHPAGYLRHLNAIYANGSRVAQLKKIKCPTLVLHGKSDPLVPYQCGVDTAQHIDNSELILIDGMGHNLPPDLFNRLVTAIVENAARGQ